MNSEAQKVIILAAKAGGKVVRSYFGKTLTITEKTIAADFKTEADVGSEKAILAILEKSFPTYNIFSEECGFIDKKSEYTFYIDPLDGTNNFALGIPNFSVSIALVRGEETVLGVVHLPMIDLTYSALKGEGAYCNGGRLRASSETLQEKSTLAVVYGYHYPKKQLSRMIDLLNRKAKRLLISWSGASDLCLVASGKIEVVVVNNIELHDFLAGKLIAKEAGCVVTDLKGKPEKNDLNKDFLVGANDVIHKKTLKLVVSSC